MKNENDSALEIKTREKRIVLTSIVGIAGNLLLVVFKAIIGLLAQSVSILMDAVNNLTDALSSIITILGTKLANKRPDKKHPFGYGRIEYITSTLIACLILFAGGSAIYESIRSLMEGTVPSYDMWAIVIVSAAIIIKIALGIFFRIQGKKTKSDALLSSGTDALMDSILSIGTLIGAIVMLTTGVSIEGYLGIAIGLFIIKSGIDALKESLSDLIGVRMDGKSSREIKDFIREKHPEIHGVYDLIVNSYGPNRKIGSAHVEVDDHCSAKEIQFLERSIQNEVYLKFGIIMTIGIYAANDSSPLSKSIKQDLISLTEKEKNFLQLHGFYVDEKTKNVVFDLIFSFDEKDPQAAEAHIVNALQAKYPDYHFSVVLDSSFTD